MGESRPGRIALVGSGEYLPVMQGVEQRLLEGRPPRYVQLATAAAPEGARSLAYWHELGAEAAARLGVEQVIVDVRNRADADNPEWAAHIAGAGLIYLSGGNPSFLARTLAGTRVWTAIHAAWRAGASLAGCSAGAMALAGRVPEFRRPGGDGVDGLGVVPEVRVFPHFDRMAARLPDFALTVATSARDGGVLGIDEHTALVADPADGEHWEFSVMGRQSAWVIGPKGRSRIEGSVRLRVDVG